MIIEILMQNANGRLDVSKYKYIISLLNQEMTTVVIKSIVIKKIMKN